MGRKQTVEEALRSMKAHNAEHVVVIERGGPVGIVRRHDLTLIDGCTDRPAEELTIEDVMDPAVYAVDVRMPLAEVVRGMAIEQLGVAVVLERSAVIGLFTAADAMGVLVSMLSVEGSRAAPVNRAPSQLAAVC
jgi:CBS domain-containing protein